MSFFPRFVEAEFAPARDLFRLMDDYASHVQTRSGINGHLSKAFTPRFDVRETEKAYELHGELPGVQHENVSIEFTDPQTLIIKGRAEHSRDEGTQSSSLAEESQTEEQSESTGSESGYQKPSVEEEDYEQVEMSGGNPDAEKQVESKKSSVQRQERQQQQQSGPPSRYWVSERSYGEFARTFAFSARVDQENVKASLRDGILSVVIPKAQAPISKRINIE